jgi:hypothetical protein
MFPAALLLVLHLSQPVTVDQALKWLPAQTETVVAVTKPGMVTNGPQTIASSCRNMLAFVGLPDEGKAYGHLRYNFIVDGSRDFTVPTEIGLANYHGCKIVGVEPIEARRLEAIVKRSAGKTIRLGTQTVYVTKGVTVQNQLTLYEAFTDDLFFAATDKTSLAEVLARRKSTGPVADFENFPERKLINQTAPFWAIRHFTAKSRNIGMGADMHDPHISGYAASLDPSQKTLTILSLSSNSDGFGIAKMLWEGFMKSEKGKGLVGINARNGAAEINADATTPEDGRLTFILLIALGHLVAV